MIYGREALRKYREQEEAAGEHQARDVDLLSRIPADAPMDDATLTVWNGSRWVSWDKWLATAPVRTDERPKETKAAPRKEAAPAADSRPHGGTQEGLW